MLILHVEGEPFPHWLPSGRDTGPEKRIEDALWHLSIYQETGSKCAVEAARTCLTGEIYRDGK